MYFIPKIINKVHHKHFSWHSWRWLKGIIDMKPIRMNLFKQIYTNETKEQKDL